METPSRQPVDPGPCRWALPDPEGADHVGLAGVGADLAPSTLIAAYRRGLFPMPIGDGDELDFGWWSPDPRGVIPLDGLRISRSLWKATKRFEIRIDTAFDEVVAECGSPQRPDGWITPEFARAYGRLHRLGWAHSVEAWRDGRLAGGLYGVSIGGLFAGESMFHRERDASKVALLALVDVLRDQYADQRVLDVQWQTPHLASLGVVRRPRAEYLESLEHCRHTPLPAVFATDS